MQPGCISIETERAYVRWHRWEKDMESGVRRGKAGGRWEGKTGRVEGQGDTGDKEDGRREDRENKDDRREDRADKDDD